MTDETLIQVQAELPPRSNGVRPGRIDWWAVKQRLIDNEGLWVLAVENVSNSTPQQLKKGGYKAFREEDLKDFEFAVRRPEDSILGPGRTNLWGRYTKPVE